MLFLIALTFIISNTESKQGGCYLWSHVESTGNILVSAISLASWDVTILAAFACSETEHTFFHSLITAATRMKHYNLTN